MSFEDTVRVNVPAELVFDFLYRAGDWPDDLAGTRPLTVQEDTPGIQVLALDGRSATGGEAVRISFPAAGRLVHKHTRTSGPLAAYTGEWTIEPQPGAGLDVTVRHDVLLNDDAALDEVTPPGGRATRSAGPAAACWSTPCATPPTRCGSCDRRPRHGRRADGADPRPAQHHPHTRTHHPHTRTRTHHPRIPTHHPRTRTRARRPAGGRARRPLRPGQPARTPRPGRADDTREAPHATEALLTEHGLSAEFVPHDLGGRLKDLEELARVLRPLFRRDLALGYGFGITSLFAASSVWTAGDTHQRAALADVLLGGGRVAIVHREVAHADSILRREVRAQRPGRRRLPAQREQGRRHERRPHRHLRRLRPHLRRLRLRQPLGAPAARTTRLRRSAPAGAGGDARHARGPLPRTAPGRRTTARQRPGRLARRGRHPGPAQLPDQPLPHPGHGARGRGQRPAARGARRHREPARRAARPPLAQGTQRGLRGPARLRRHGRHGTAGAQPRTPARPSARGGGQIHHAGPAARGPGRTRRRARRPRLRPRPAVRRLPETRPLACPWPGSATRERPSARRCSYPSCRPWHARHGSGPPNRAPHCSCRARRCHRSTTAG
ncbi:hypothetical protein SROCM77S_01155 [Streptomyces rochei]